jgi:hypothetical protein
MSNLNDGQISKFLFVFEGIGIIFIGSFLTAYLLGLPSYNVYHSDPTLRLVLSIFGTFLVLFVIVALGFSTWVNKKK